MAAKLLREQWLNRAADLMRPDFKAAGFPMPKKIRFCTGWPSRRATASTKTRIGECWSPSASSDGTVEIFISPILDSAEKVLPTLRHELVHASVGNKEGHKGKFVECAKKLGFKPKWTSSANMTDELVARNKRLAGKLPKFPHARLNPSGSPVKKQGTRMLKCECDACGYTVRITRKWLDEVGAPLCPDHGEMKVEN